MELLADLAAWSLLVLSLLLFVAQLLAYAGGHWAGSRHRGNHPTRAEGVSLIVGGLLGLLSFVLALTLSYGSARFNERRNGALNEANAIATAWQRSEALAHPRGREIARLIESYAQARKTYVQSPRHAPVLDEIGRRTSALHSEIWGRISAVAQERADPVVASLMAAVNEMFDQSAIERFSYESPFPPQLFWLLIAMALITMAALGYQLGLKQQETHFLAVVMTVVWTAVIAVILDISSPRIGSIRTDASIYDWTLEGFKREGGAPSDSARR
ncbi:MAG: hypothetical protein AB7O44_25530 [Hyphomicrobiaceae bacterium]